MSSAPLRRVSSRALRAASRACAASTTLPTTTRASCGCSSNHCDKQFVDQALDDRADLGGDQLVLGLGREFRVGAFDAEHASQALASVLAGQIDLLLLEQPRAFGIADHLTGERAAQADEMRAAVALGDVVGEGQHILVVAVVPPQSDFDADAVALALDEDRAYRSARSWRGRDSARRPRGRLRRCSSSRLGSAWRRSVNTIRTPELRNASSRRRCSMVA